MSSNDQEIFWQLGRNANGAPLPPPYHRANARDVASAIRDDLTEVGLSCHAIRRVACALLNVSVSTRRSSVAPPDRQTRGGRHQ